MTLSEILKRTESALSNFENDDECLNKRFHYSQIK